ncbi:cell division protein FtsL [Snodgrassella sp. CFCC 13594]|uniref:cell division protein FtsL n=1 Tax=Snodgrassella sp. CFCC 13594 TaxID=1775559 RepID=UPI00082F98C6|nr:cell division protein FtsL [Snodgrassella sp. CFCC 13594]
MNKLNVFLLVLVLVSAFAVVTVQDRSRQYFIVLDKAQKGEGVLNDDYSRLKITQAKLANHQFIQQSAAEQQLQPPTLAQTQMLVVKP